MTDSSSAGSASDRSDHRPGAGVAVVTGAGSGIGAASADALAAAGAAVVCADIDGATAKSTAQRLPKAIAHEVDVRSEQGCETLMQTAVDTFGGVDAVVAAAGVEGQGPAEGLALEAFTRTVDINLTGSFLTARAAARQMIRRGSGGRVVLIGSINSQVALAGQAAYAASKGGVLMLGRALAVDWAPHGILVNIIGPGITDTPLSAASLADPVRRRMLLGRVPLGRPAAPSEIAQVIAFLVSEQSSYMTGAYVPVDGGWLAHG